MHIMENSNTWTYSIWENEEQFNELKENGFGPRFTGFVFSAIHSDLVTELFNKETKGFSVPFHWVFITDIDSVNTWLNTIHISLKLLKDSNYISKKI